MQLLSDCDFAVIMPSGIKLSVNMAIVIMQRCIELSGISSIFLSVIMLSGIMLNVIMLSVIIFSEIMRVALC